eukprot:3897798-Amphidinium_carterae.1
MPENKHLIFGGDELHEVRTPPKEKGWDSWLSVKQVIKRSGTVGLLSGDYQMTSLLQPHNGFSGLN